MKTRIAADTGTKNLHRRLNCKDGRLQDFLSFDSCFQLFIVFIFLALYLLKFESALVRIPMVRLNSPCLHCMLLSGEKQHRVHRKMIAMHLR